MRNVVLFCSLETPPLVTPWLLRSSLPCSRFLDVTQRLGERCVTSKKQLRGILWLLKRCNKKLTLITEAISAKALDKDFFYYTTD